MTLAERRALIAARDAARKDPRVFLRTDSPRMRAWKVGQLKRARNKALPEWRAAREGR